MPAPSPAPGALSEDPPWTEFPAKVQLVTIDSASITKPPPNAGPPPPRKPDSDPPVAVLFATVVPRRVSEPLAKIPPPNAVPPPPPPVSPPPMTELSETVQLVTVNEPAAMYTPPPLAVDAGGPLLVLEEILLSLIVRVPSR